MASWAEWLEVAKRDLAAAQNDAQAGFYSHACFNCQQAVEKALKALMLLKKGRLEKTHSLRELAEKAGVIVETRDLISDLDADYTATRYFDAAGTPPSKLYDERKFKSRFAAATKTLELVEEWTKS
ncbi:MAG: HEPN domain-containing protein [Candidatus Micrarchaeota archaeon]